MCWFSSYRAVTRGQRERYDEANRQFSFANEAERYLMGKSSMWDAAYKY
jgi:hypothetical protein